MRAPCFAGLLLVVACGDNFRLSPDAQPDTPDSPVPDGIAEARAAGDGTGLDLAIRNVTVTYLKPQIGNLTNDPAGFTIQASREGPALFVSVDPATLTPPASIGDVVSFQITTLGTVSMQKRAQAISGYTRVSTGADVDQLAKDISLATDVVSMIDSYDSELVTVSGTLFQDLAGAGQGFLSAGLSTSGISAEPNFKLRAPVTVINAIDLARTCEVAAVRVPISRFGAQAQLGVYRASDVTLSGCPAPVVTAAFALSDTSMRVLFSRNIKASSVLVDGSQFMFDNGVAASAAAASGRTVVVTTSAQMLGTDYTVTVAGTVTDLQGTGVGAMNNALFPGVVPPAVVRINEVNANIANGCDLIELRVVSGGSMAGHTLKERGGNSGELNLTFPSFNVQANEFIVVHTSSGSAMCNPSGATQETISVSEQPTATHAANFDTAYDFWNADTGLTATDNVFTLFDRTGAIMDAVFTCNDPATTDLAAATATAAGIVGAASQWDPALAAYTGVLFRTNAVDDLNGTGTTAAGTTIQRVDNTDDNNKADWTTGAGVASTWGALNAGQTAF